jgi:hypothetical protein
MELGEQFTKHVELVSELQEKDKAAKVGPYCCIFAPFLHFT